MPPADWDELLCPGEKLKSLKDPYGWLEKSNELALFGWGNACFNVLSSREAKSVLAVPVCEEKEGGVTFCTEN